MLFDFQVLYRPTGPEFRQLESVTVRAATSEEARAAVEGNGLSVHGVTQGLPAVDWTKPVFTKQEAQVFLDVKDSAMGNFMASGELPKAKHGYPLFPRKCLEDFVERRMGLKKRAA